LIKTFPLAGKLEFVILIEAKLRFDQNRELAPCFELTSLRLHSIIRFMSWWKRTKYTLQIIIFGLVFLFAIGPATVPVNDPQEQIRAFTRALEFDFVDWTIDAALTKIRYGALGLADYLDREQQREVVFQYLDLVRQIRSNENQLTLIYSDPNIVDPAEAARPVSELLEELYQQRGELQPLTEMVIQQMVSMVIKEMDLDFIGQPIPQVMYHSTPLPWAMIVSPRDVIRQDANISLEVDLTVENHILLEDQIASNLDVSTLVVPVGGIGTYPSMIAQTTNINWLMSVVSHEWIHNYLTLNPLGVRYGDSPEMRTINETTASIAGGEIGAAIIAEFFPEHVPPPPLPQPVDPQPEPEPPAFDFRAEMNETRVTTDELLVEGQVEEAETYMEARRQFFWDTGYSIRKLNQAYFAFYGAYADTPGGSAGEDPVGEAVRDLRSHSNSLGEFVASIADVKTFDQLLELVESTGPIPE
jgi:hypothetical protein